MIRTKLRSSSLCLFLLLFLQQVSSTSSPPNPHNVRCSENIHCGNRTDITVTYPFRLLHSPSYCGYPGFELNCISDNAHLTIKLGQEDYTVQNIDYEKNLIQVVNSGFVSTDCPSSFTNTSISSTPFNYASFDSNLTVYENCIFQTKPPGLQEIPCPSNINGSEKSYYRFSYGPSTFLEDLNGGCERAVLLVVYNTSEFDKALKGGFGLTWNYSGMDWCQDCINSGGFCGYNDTQSEHNVCYCSDDNRPNSCANPTNQKSKGKGLIIGLPAVLACLLLACIPLYFYIIKSNRLIFWKKNNAAPKIEAFLDAYEYLRPKRFKYSALKKITKSFSEKLGQGGYGAVFKGEFLDGRLVAVKVLSDAKGNGGEFVNEVASIGRTSHVNVVSLLGFCSEGSKRALIYEFMPNGSLEKYIYSENLRSTLGWDKLYKIAVGIARGLEYLHRGCNTHIVHFDIKPQNILLDLDFCPKISDFGLAQLCLRKDSIFSAIDIRGTIGYIAPEVFSRNFGVVSSKSDVYSYGMMILEMLGVRNTSHSCNESDSGYYFPDWIYEHYNEIGHMEGLDVTAETTEIAKKMVLVGLWCIQTKPGSRPSMSKVVDMLQSNIDDLEMPPKPYLSSP